MSAVRHHRGWGLRAAGLVLLASIGCGGSPGSSGDGGGLGGLGGGHAGASAMGGAGALGAGDALAAGGAAGVGAGASAGAAGGGGTPSMFPCDGPGTECILGQQYCYTFTDLRPDAGTISSTCLEIPSNCLAADGGISICGCVADQIQCAGESFCSSDGLFVRLAGCQLH